MIDTHVHLWFERFNEDRDEVLARAREAGVTGMVHVGIDAGTSRRALELARRCEASGGPARRGTASRHRTAVGLHPTSRVADLEAELEEIERLARAAPERVVAIGEIGLDDHWKEVPASEQAPRLRRQLELARALALPVIFHCRDALGELFALLEAEPALPGGVFHCFAGGRDDARRAQEIGFHVSFAGNVTYPPAEELREAAAAVSLDRLLLETDSPFLPPQAHRGRRNEPAWVTSSRDLLAEIHGVSPSELAARTTANAERLFRF